MPSIDPSQIHYNDLYKLMVSAIAPRPIALVSSMDKDGVLNLAPFSYFTACSSNPPVICFCSAVRSGPQPHKDTLANIRATGEFVINVVTEELAGPMNATAAEVAPEIDEFAVAGLTPLASESVKVPRVAESPIQMECTLRQIIEVSPLPGGGNLVLGEVKRLHIDESVMEEGKIDPDRLHLVGRMGGPLYIRTNDLFALTRPR